MSDIDDSIAQAVADETAVASPPRRDHEDFLRFLVTGGIAAGVNLVSRWLLGFALSYEVAIAVAYLIGMTTAFVLARMFVFEARGSDVKTSDIRGQYLRFTLVNAIAFAQVWCVSVVLARFAFPALGFTWHAETIAHAIGIVSPVLTSYVGHKRFTFRA